MGRNGTTAMERLASQPKTITLKVTQEQIDGIKQRQQALAFGQTLGTFLDGVISGHGHKNATVTEYDDKKLTLTITTK